MRILFAGTPTAALPTLEAIAASDHDIVAVLTRADARQGRGRHLMPSPVKARALELGIPVHTERPRGTEFKDWLAGQHIDVAVVVAYGEILLPDVLEAVPNGWINLHFSLLPAWRGAAPVQRAIIAGDEYTGASAFVIVPELDAGPVLGVLTQRIDPTSTAGSLLATLAEAGAPLMTSVLDAIAAGDAQLVPQRPDAVSYAPKLTPGEGEIDWRQPAQRIDRQVRGFTPAPGAWTTTAGGQRLGVGPVHPAAQPPSQPDGTPAALAPGQLLVTKRDVWVGTGTAAVRLSTVTAPGKVAMSAADWARGARLAPDERLGAAATMGELS